MNFTVALENSPPLLPPLSLAYHKYNCISNRISAIDLLKIIGRAGTNDFILCVNFERMFLNQKKVRDCSRSRIF